MKTLFVFLVIVFSTLSSFGQKEISVGKKTFVKGAGYIANKEEPTSLTRSMSPRAETNLRRALPNVYVLTADEELRRVIKSVIPADVVEKYKEQSMTVRVRVAPDGKAKYVVFGIAEESPLYNIDMSVYSKLEDALKSSLVFNIPNKSIPMFWFSLRSFRLSQLQDDGQLFNPNIYKPRQ